MNLQGLLGLLIILGGTLFGSLVPAGIPIWGSQIHNPWLWEMEPWFMLFAFLGGLGTMVFGSFVASKA